MQFPVRGSAMEHRATSSILLACFFFFLCMDIHLYRRIQDIPPVRLKNRTDHGKIKISPFENLSIKEMMIDHVDHYIHYPLAQYFFKVTNFPLTFHLISANAISFCGVLFALAAARCVSSQNLYFHWLAVLLLQVRSWMDALDGVVARYRIGITKIVPTRSFGFYVDGVADAVSYTVFMFGCRAYLNTCIVRDPPYTSLSTSNCAEKDAKNVMTSWTTSKIFFVCLRFGIQLMVAAVLWDRYVQVFHQVLETPQATEQMAIAQNDMLKSPGTLATIWIWRFCNAHALIKFLLLAIFLNRLWDFLLLFQYVGYIVLFATFVISEMQVTYMSKFMKSL